MDYTVTLFAQKESNNWYLGNKAGLNFFSSYPATPILNNNAITYEGCASISDAFGAILFFTNENSVFSNNHYVMQGGDSIINYSPTQHCIVPDPVEANKFYSFQYPFSLQ